MWMLIARGVIAGAVIVGVTVLANRSPRMGAFLLTLALVTLPFRPEVRTFRCPLKGVQDARGS
jgi:hypothetical protein